MTISNAMDVYPLRARLSTSQLPVLVMWLRKSLIFI